MSKGAKRLMRDLNILDFASDEPKIDAAVAPLVSLRDERKQWSETRWHDEPELNRDWWRRFDIALEQWRTGR